MDAYRENKYISPLKIRSYAGLVSNLNSHFKATATDIVIWLPKKKNVFAEYILVEF